ncbi:ABC transporter substrate-binding protein [Acidisoma cladoniae]|jgi:ribose transport system substrate-binding protein|uniref:ABC transporter substrate-binding protein n=1 Tax=Acidisoma cladoniae TaxID=3040935 RepID=UPI002550331F|nr:ABC transporter substrate-binding protein [Acidisoma sp. PAMC 29798]
MTMLKKTLLAASMLTVLAAWQTPVWAQTIPVIVKDTTSQYWQVVLAGARQAGKELHIKVPELGAQSEADIAGQVTALENASSESPAAIVIAPTQFSALGAPITAAAADTKIIGIDSSADTKSFTSFLSTNNVTGGMVAADALAAGIKAKTGKAEGDVAIITSLPGVGSLDQRAAGFKQELAKYPGLTLIANRIADGQPTTGLNIMTDLITAHPHLVGVFASNLQMVQGASQGLAESGNKTITLIGFDSDKGLVSALRQGVVTALIVQDPYRMGYEGVEIAYKASKGEAVPVQIDTGVTAITAANLDDPKSQALLNPKL